MNKMDRVAILDDSEDFLLYLEKILRTFHFEVGAFARPDEFMQSLSRKTPDVIFLDMVMDEKDGIQILEMLAERQCTTPIVLVSASDNSVLAAGARFAKMIGLKVAGTLHKPFWRGEVGNLLDAIRDASEDSNQIQPARIEESLTTGMIAMHYQPKVDCTDQRLLGVEALVRLRMGNGRLLQPQRFLSTVNDAKLMRSLTRRVVKAVVADMALLNSQGFDLDASINIGLDALEQDNLPEIFSTLCLHYKVASSRFTLELGGASLGWNSPPVLKGATRVRLLGMGLAIEDFGSGEVSEDQLPSLPITEIKIDGDLVRSVTRDVTALAKVRRIVRMGEELNLTVVAKGVETEELMQMLQRLGCSAMQGFVIGRPMPIEDLTNWIKQWQERTSLESAQSA